MGSVFPHVADSALYPCGGEECHYCGRTDLAVYRYAGEILNPKGAADPALAVEEPDVSELCAPCILGGNVGKSASRIEEMLPTISRFAADPERAAAEYHRLPDLPLFLQRDDWPICCGEWCEFNGIPADYDEARRLPTAARYWERGPDTWPSGWDLGPESLREVSRFRCTRCSHTWFTWQST